jgi:hypothetical protein
MFLNLIRFDPWSCRLARSSHFQFNAVIDTLMISMLSINDSFACSRRLAQTVLPWVSLVFTKWLYVLCYMSYVACPMLRVLCYVFCVDCSMLHVLCCISHVTVWSSATQCGTVHRATKSDPTIMRAQWLNLVIDTRVTRCKILWWASREWLGYNVPLDFFKPPCRKFACSCRPLCDRFVHSPKVVKFVYVVSLTPSQVIALAKGCQALFWSVSYLCVHCCGELHCDSAIATWQWSIGR